MAQLKLPFGRGHITADIPDGRLAGVLQSRAHSYQAKADQPELVRQALENPTAPPACGSWRRARTKWSSSAATTPARYPAR